MVEEPMARLARTQGDYARDKQRVAASMSARDDAALVAHEAGASLAQIAKVTGTTRSGVQGIIERAKAALSNT
jgi:DNA-directed RNA polymerase specialized sigma24 family protein